MRKFEFVGSIEFGEFIDIVDPSYDSDARYRLNNVRIEPGVYRCYTAFRDCGKWGKSVSAIAITKRASFLKCNKGIIGGVIVNSGLAGFFENKPDYIDNDYVDFECDEFEGLGYGDNVFLFPNNECYARKGFFSNSGFGNGGYTVYCHRNDSGIPNALVIKFL